MLVKITETRPSRKTMSLIIPRVSRLSGTVFANIILVRSNGLPSIVLEEELFGPNAYFEITPDEA